MPIVFTRKRPKHENTRSPPFLYDTKMAADSYWARKALILRERLYLTSNKRRIPNSNAFKIAMKRKDHEKGGLQEILICNG